MSDASGELKFTEEAQGRITRLMFDSNDAFVFDAGHEGQWISYYHLTSILNEVEYHVGTCIDIYFVLSCQYLYGLEVKPLSRKEDLRFSMPRIILNSIIDHRIHPSHV